MTKNIPNIHVGIVGGSQSGKTLYLSCLQRFVDRNFDGITFGGADDESSEWLKNRTSELNRGILPLATLDKKNLRFILRDLENRLIEIKILDRRGGDYQEKPDSELIEYLSACTGFIVLVDPLETLDEQSAFYRPLFETLSNHIHQSNNIRKRKRFSICLTKIDNPKFWNWYKDNKKNFSGIRPEDKARGIFDSWFKAQGDEEDFTKPLRITFGEQNFQYHLISSIGFFSTDVTNLTVTLNENGVVEGRLRTGKKYSPVNLYKPLYWAMGGDN